MVVARKKMRNKTKARKQRIAIINPVMKALFAVSIYIALSLRIVSARSFE